MVIDDDSVYLLYMEPSRWEKIGEPIEDKLTKCFDLAINSAQKGAASYGDFDGSNFKKGSGWMGMHRTDCGQSSSSCDYLLENGMITNSLAPYYIRYYRKAIPASQWRKIGDLYEFYKTKIT